MWKKNRDGTPRKFLVLVAAVLTLTSSLLFFSVAQGSDFRASSVWRDTNTIYADNYVAKVLFSSTGTAKTGNGVYIMDPTGTTYYHRISFQIQRDNAGTIETYLPLATTDITYTDGTGFVRAVIKSTLALWANDTITIGTLTWNVTFYANHFDMFVNITTDAANKITGYTIYWHNYRTTTTTWYVPVKLKDTPYIVNQTFGRKIYGDRAYVLANDVETGFSLFAETRDPLLRDVSHPAADGNIYMGYIGQYNTRYASVTSYLYASRFAEPRKYTFYISTGAYGDLLKRFKGYTVWPYPYGLEGVFTITWDDGVPNNGIENDTAFAELATKYNFYYNRYIWLYFPDEATAGKYFKATPAWLDQNSTLLSAYQNLTKMGIYVDMHTPSRLNDTRSIFIIAIDKMNTYFPGKWGIVYQPHGTNAENPNEQGSNPANTTYFTYDLIVQNYHFLNDRYWGADPALSQTDRKLLDLFEGNEIIYYSDYYSPTAYYNQIALVTRNQYNNSGVNATPLVDVIGKADIDYIVSNNAACVLYIHHPYSADTVPRLEALFKYIASKPLWTPTASEFYEFVYALSHLNISITGNMLTIENPTDFAISGLTLEPSSDLAITDNGKVLPHSEHGYILPQIAAHSVAIFMLKDVKSFEYYPTHLGAADVNIYKGSDGIHVKVTGHGTVTVHIENIWNSSDVKVYDLTTGKEVKWREGSIIFNATAGHEYIVELPTGFAAFISSLSSMDVTNYGIIAGVLIAIIIAAVLYKPHKRRHR